MEHFAKTLRQPPPRAGRLRRWPLAASAAFCVALAIPGPASAYLLGPTFLPNQLSPGKWGPSQAGTGATVTWSIMPAGTDCNADPTGPIACTAVGLQDFMPAGYLSAIQRAFAAWAAVADLTFVQVADDGAPFDATTQGGDIRLGGQPCPFPSASCRTHGFYPPLNGVSAAGDIFYTPATLLPRDEEFVFQETMHWLGISLGLDFNNDPASLMYSQYQGNFAGPQADDIAGVQFLYGPPGTNPNPNPTPVPEPGALALLGAGLAFIGLLSRRRGRAGREQAA